MYELIDGKKISAEIKQEIADETAAFVAKGGAKPHLAAILVGNDGASETYVAHKVKACAQAGFDSSLFRFDETATEVEILAKIKEINENTAIHGLIVQLPLPNHISEEKVIQAIL